MYKLLRTALFALPPETAHRVSLGAVDVAGSLGLAPLLAPQCPDLPVDVMGLKFANPVGLAAGLDKNADHFNGLGKLGFGFVEVGTVTPRAQPGNPQPRLFRLPEHRAIINRMGFNNLGVDHLVEQVKKRRYRGVLGINIGKNFDTPVERALDDYLLCLDKVYAHADYIAVNISSPNTPGLRDLQQGDSLDVLLGGLKQRQQQLADTHGRYVPLTVKIAPDMDNNQINALANRLVTHSIDAVTATNTTVSRVGVEASSLAGEKGGLSGLPLRQRSTGVIASLSKALDGALPIIGVGGICSGDNAAEKIAAGASLVQLYTGFIYEGPGLIKKSVEAIAALRTPAGPFR